MPSATITMDAATPRSFSRESTTVFTPATLARASDILRDRGTAAFAVKISLRDAQEAASYVGRRTTARYEWARSCRDRHATYTVAVDLADAAR